ncbi:MAG: hypothetical protein EZS28_013849 [Streblomastix strix]|uniref:Uncharacterized protein n=1 Tax=Streblomastix strix TaxID=222440 RepID=A0A5J4W7I6_9EUKA|nr:MAG: hypothetical protein EZS28_013849 [Streblomastix strix]
MVRLVLELILRIVEEIIYTPQQLTYDNDITATKFIKIGEINQQILLANGDTTTLDIKLSRTYNITAGGWIRQCVFPAGASVGTSAIYSAYVRIESAGTVTIVVSDQSTYYTNRITEILTQDVVSGVANGTQIPITYDLANGGIFNNTLQVNPTGRTYTTYNNGIRIGNYNTEYSSLYLGCSTTAINTTQSGQWEISKTSDNALTINPSSLRQAEHSVGLSINGDSSIIKFNGNELVNVGTDQTITGRKTFAGVILGNIQLNTTDVSYGEGEIDGQYTIIKRIDVSLIISRTVNQNIQDKGLKISADGNTLSFNGSVIAGTGATSGANNGSVNYSAGNPILRGQNSTDPIGGFYSDGAKVQWRAHSLKLGSVPP